MAKVSLHDVPQGEKFRYLDHEWTKGARTDDRLWINANPHNEEGLFQQLWYDTYVEYTEPVDPPKRGEVWDDGSFPGHDEGIPTVWLCQGLTMATARGVTVRTDIFLTEHRPSSTRVWPPAE